jgi:deazaflavin-dependent oxidoreductase (nitroreductase family)
MSSLHTLVYRTTSGRIGRRLVNNDMLLLTTLGRRTGIEHTVPLLYLREGQRLVVIASYGGRPEHPEWYLNLEAHPQAAVQIFDEHIDVEAATMTDAEHSKWWPQIVDAYGDYAVYQSRTDRQIPVVWLDGLSAALYDEVPANG